MVRRPSHLASFKLGTNKTHTDNIVANIRNNIQYKKNIIQYNQIYNI